MLDELVHSVAKELLATIEPMVCKLERYWRVSLELRLSRNGNGTDVIRARKILPKISSIVNSRSFRTITVSPFSKRN